MADWFKFYENDLDETRLQYAIAKMPEVVSVWVGILSEACRHKSGIVSWGTDEIELFGFSRRLGISLGKVNECINLLVEIRYITLGDGMITVIKWHEKQSEYCQKRTKMQNQVGSSNHNSKAGVGTVSGQCRDSVGQEERRIEENRGEDTTKSALPPKGKVYSPESREVLKYLNEKTGRSFRESETSLSVIQARLNESGVEIDGVKVMIDRQCTRWKGTPQEEYLRPETLFGKTKFDSYYAAKDAPVHAPNGHSAGLVLSPSVEAMKNQKSLDRVEGRMKEIRGNFPLSQGDKRIQEFADLKIERARLMSLLGFKA